MSEPMDLKTADLCDAHAGSPHFQVAEPGFLDYGGRRSFSGPISTVRAPEDNSLVRKALEEPGQGRVLVVDGGGSRRCALVGDQLAALAQKNGWAGVVVNGCIRDAEAVGLTAIGVKALGTHPLKSGKRNEGQREVEVRFAGVTFRPGHYLYADADGIVTSEKALSAEPSKVSPLVLANPKGLYDPTAHGYSHVARVAPGSRLIYIAGQGGENEAGALQPDFRLQVRQALSNLRTALESAGAGVGDVAKLTVLIVDHSEERLKVFGSELERAWTGGMKPTCTLIPVPRLALDGMLFEVEAVAVLPA